MTISTVASQGKETLGSRSLVTIKVYNTVDCDIINAGTTINKT